MSLQSPEISFWSVVLGFRPNHLTGRDTKMGTIDELVFVCFFSTFISLPFLHKVEINIV